VWLDASSIYSIEVITIISFLNCKTASKIKESNPKRRWVQFVKTNLYRFSWVMIVDITSLRANTVVLFLRHRTENHIPKRGRYAKCCVILLIMVQGMVNPKDPQKVPGGRKGMYRVMHAQI
jgi:hypothetical protein